MSNGKRGECACAGALCLLADQVGPARAPLAGSLWKRQWSHYSLWRAVLPLGLGRLPLNLSPTPVPPSSCSLWAWRLLVPCAVPFGARAEARENLPSSPRQGGWLMSAWLVLKRFTLAALCFSDESISRELP